MSCATSVIYTASVGQAYLTRRHRCAGGAIVAYEVYAEPPTAKNALDRNTIALLQVAEVYDGSVSVSR